MKRNWVEKFCFAVQFMNNMNSFVFYKVYKEEKYNVSHNIDTYNSYTLYCADSQSKNKSCIVEMYKRRKMKL